MVFKSLSNHDDFILSHKNIHFGLGYSLTIVDIKPLFEISFFFFDLNYFFFLFVVNFVIHWNKTAMGLHVFPIPIPPPTSLSTRSP